MIFLGVPYLNDYTRGAFEALSWIQTILEDLENRPDAVKTLRKEIEEAISDIRRGIGVDFRFRLRISA